MRKLPYGSKIRELDRTAEMFLENVKSGNYSLALWLVYDSNRYDQESLKILCELVQEKSPNEPKKETYYEEH